MSNLKERPLPDPDHDDDGYGHPADAHVHYPRLAGEDAGPEPGRDDLALELGDFLHRIPQHLLFTGPHDTHTPLYFDLGQVAAMLSRGESNILLGDIFDRVPHIFPQEPIGHDNVEIRFPWQKVLKLISESSAAKGASAPESLAHKLHILELARTQAATRTGPVYGGSSPLRAIAAAGGRPRFWVRQPATGAPGAPPAPAPPAPQPTTPQPAPPPAASRAPLSKRPRRESLAQSMLFEPAPGASYAEPTPDEYTGTPVPVEHTPHPEIVRSDREYRRQIDELNRRILALEGNQRERTQEISRETELRLKAERQLASAERALQESAAKIEQARVETRHHLEAELHRRDEEIDKLREQLTRASSAIGHGLHAAEDHETASRAAASADFEWQARVICQLESDVESYRTRIRSLLAERESLTSERDTLLREKGTAPGGAAK